MTDLSRVSLQSLTGEGLGDLPEFAIPPAEPLALAEAWIARAIDRGIREPGAFVLATADADAIPSSRFVLLKGFDERGLTFVSQTTSRKGHDIAANPHASATFYWQEFRQQLHIAGPVAPLDAAESDALWSARPLASRAGAVTSHQSEPLIDDNVFRSDVARIIAAGRPVDRPDRWTGYRIAPTRIEFWQGDPARVHRRLEYTLTDTASWEWQRLQP
ncbi:MAG: pyridoxamine 5'-phosphate oxidase [Solirubrobacterales bacterium]